MTLKLLFLVILSGFRTESYVDHTTVQRGNQIMGVFTDGWICYGERARPGTEPEVHCHRSIPIPEIK